MLTLMPVNARVLWSNRRRRNGAFFSLLNWSDGGVKNVSKLVTVTVRFFMTLLASILLGEVEVVNIVKKDSLGFESQI
jgi:hypothetical protein